jgi:threonine/homoserine/homoserine lactone efflux protein
MINFLFTGTVLGLSAGFAPGPLLALVISETLRHDRKAGIKVAVAPILTDLPIIIITLFILAKLSGFHKILGIISILGALFILYMGYGSLRIKKVNTDIDHAKPKSLQKGLLVNALSPHPYLFWFSVGGPITVKAFGQSIFAATAFIVSFYVLLIGSKVALAILVGRYKSFLHGKIYMNTMRTLGFVLVILAIFLFRDGLKLFGVL